MCSGVHSRASARRVGDSLPRAVVAAGLTALGWGAALGLASFALRSWLGTPAAQWTVARAAGITSYVLLVVLVAVGLWLAGPRRAGLGAFHSATIMRIHTALASATLAFVALHVVVLISDSHAGVGLHGALVPLASTYRPVPVTLGVLGLYAGLVAGLTARFAAGLGRRIWLPVHRVAVIAFLLVWAHSVTAGTDSRVLMALYVGSAVGLGCLAVFRYAASTPVDAAARRASLARVDGGRAHSLEADPSGREPADDH